MIGLQVTTIGGAQIEAALEKAPRVIRSRLVDALGEQGETAAARARDAAPYNSRRAKGVHLRDAIRYHAWANEAQAELLVRAVGGRRGAPHAHLIERGVERQKIRVTKKAEGPANRVRSKKTGRFRFVKARRVLMYTRMHQIRANPFFEPAIRSLGDVGATLQAAIDQAAADVQGGA